MHHSPLLVALPFEFFTQEIAQAHNLRSTPELLLGFFPTPAPTPDNLFPLTAVVFFPLADAGVAGPFLAVVVVALGRPAGFFFALGGIVAILCLFCGN